LYGFPKNERGNITQKEEIALKGLAEFFSLLRILSDRLNAILLEIGK
jgi:hypothetical protein